MRVFRQRYGGTCAPRSLCTALSHYNYFPSYKKVKKLCKTNSEGTYLEDLETAVEILGVRTDTRSHTASEYFIKFYTDKSKPVLVNWYADSEIWHMATVYKVDEKYIYLLDTSLHLYLEPEVRMKRGALDRCWKKHPDSRWMMAILGVT